MADERIDFNRINIYSLKSREEKALEFMWNSLNVTDQPHETQRQHCHENETIKKSRKVSPKVLSKFELRNIFFEFFSPNVYKHFDTDTNFVFCLRFLVFIFMSREFFVCI